MKVLLFGGASETRGLTAALAVLPLTLTVSVTSDYGRGLLSESGDYGRGLLPEPGGFTLRVGVLDARQMEDFVRAEGFGCLIDATHPYAAAASANIRAAAMATGTPCLRLLRPSSNLDGCTVVDNPEQAAAELNRLSGAALLTTGSKDLRCFAAVRDYQQRLYARVLPTAQSIAACVELGFPPGHIIAMQGPFSASLNAALLREFKIETLVTKDGGLAGGFPEKVQAARELGVKIIVIGRPEEQQPGLSQPELLRRVAEMLEAMP